MLKKPIAIVAGEPNSISSEIIFKVWKFRKKFKHKPIIIIGNINLLIKQKKKLGVIIKFKEIKKNFTLKELSGNKLPVYNVEYNQRNPFEKISKKSNKYIYKCFQIATNLIEDNKVLGLINCPISKESLFNNKYSGVTEFLSKKSNAKGNEVMLIFNKQLSVSPITTHLPLNKIFKKINKEQIIKKIKIINSFYIKNLKKKPTIAVLGLNPHNSTGNRNSEEIKIIKPAIESAKKMNIKAIGPISTDTSFVIYKKYKFDVIVGMYHDQVLTPYKALFKYNAINITLGLPYIRVSPDHGVAQNIMGKNIANPDSLVESIKFFNYFK